MVFTDSDRQQLAAFGITPEQVQSQVEIFKKGIPYLELQKPAILDDGIIKLDDNELLLKISMYNQEIENLKIIKFVPASGAASRMFKTLFEYLGSDNSETFLSDKGFNSISVFFERLKDFAFYHDLMNCSLLKDVDTGSTIEINNYKKVLSALLSENGLNYGNKPKGLIQFHTYGKESKTPSQEHIMEGTLYACSNDEVYIHFTVSPEHLELFKEHVRKSIPAVEKKFELTCYVSFSLQKKSTDTVAVDANNDLFRNDDGTLLFRPGGHGALIENLNELDADVVFIKNIDNVVPDRLKKETIDYKKALAGLMIEFQKKIFSYIFVIQDIKPEDKLKFEEIEQFVFRHLFIEPANGYSNCSFAEKKEFLFRKLNRPIRVCGMVKNEGEPGGGPFWAKNPDGTFSLQIVESSQIDFSIPATVEIVKKSSHFNPVDLVCGIKDYRGNSFDLRQFVDPDTGFISEKSKDGKSLKALELPGLWNGAMSDWNTLFVEVPLITFNPVKTVNDLLRTEHQPENE